MAEGGENGNMLREYDDAALDKGHAVCEDASTTVIHGAWNADRISEGEWIMQFYKAVFSSSVHDGICMTVNKSLGFQFSMFRRSVDEAMPSPGHRDMDGASAATVGNTARVIHRNGGFSFDTERCQLHETTNFGGTPLEARKGKAKVSMLSAMTSALLRRLRGSVPTNANIV
ncbi:hypothetical protein HPB50_015287 [Hyalomma asiaticum]|uniref:Uncharacterized protein n=1 Tax=Hyalomma asiaticum TaxID=266040 RepID=A0ACB7TN42_HYAAI|nr:hypothetical protein HPB50_015287 [Hyalomma asiaticum]